MCMPQSLKILILFLKVEYYNNEKWAQSRTIGKLFKHKRLVGVENNGKMFSFRAGFSYRTWTDYEVHKSVEAHNKMCPL